MKATGLNLVSKAGAYLRVAPYSTPLKGKATWICCKYLTIPKMFASANTLAYLTTASETQKKEFIAKTPGVQVQVVAKPFEPENDRIEV